ncbi:MAG: exodeoxyribonuclease I [Gammaproteobacteria bacterium]|nr:exodeoxyribonuclease I [Gammaproteobacteria bacterium]
MATSSNSFYWYDLETTGLETRWDRITQFAGQRTDLDMNVIGDPFVTYVQPPPEVLPDPESALITGITPQHLQAEGISEWEAINRIHSHLSQPDTCTIGYNNLSFDDEFVRFALYRNLLPPYKREFNRGNSRFDLYTVVKAAAAMRPDRIEWPFNDEGEISPNLSALAQANGIDPSGAHDALSDVQMSIAVARLIKRAEPKMWTYLYNHRSRQEIERVLRDGSGFYLHVASIYGAKRRFAAPIRVLATNPAIGSRVLVADLTADLSMLETATPDELHQARFLSKQEAEATNRKRLALSEVATNKCPVFVGLDVLGDTLANRLQVDVDVLNHNIELIERIGQQDLESRMHEMMRISNERHTADSNLDVSERLYDGFINRKDENLCESIHEAIKQGTPWPEVITDDDRIHALASRLKRDLVADESGLTEDHRAFVQSMLNRDEVGFHARNARIKELRDGELSTEQEQILNDVETYIEIIATQYGIR